MDHPFTLPDHPELNLSLRMGGVMSGATILKDGCALVKTRNTVTVPLATGSSIILKIKVGMDLFTPKIEYAGKTIDVLPPLPVLWIIWAYLPLALIIIGGAIGGLCGGAASASTFAVLRSRLPAIAKYPLAILFPLIGLIAYATAAFHMLKSR